MPPTYLEPLPHKTRPVVAASYPYGPRLNALPILTLRLPQKYRLFAKTFHVVSVCIQAPERRVSKDKLLSSFATPNLRIAVILPSKLWLPIPDLFKVTRDWA